jgi:SAM-dependent methyltransferase
MSNFPDHFSAAAEQYARFRPRYPEALFAFLASLCTRRALAWDCATGSGQAALGLAAHFESVVATDAAGRQIASALSHRKVIYRVAPGEESGLESSSADLVTIAQALHWLDLPRFFAEVNRVLVPGGVLAAWSYKRLVVDAAVDAVIGRYYEEIVGPYWPPERVTVEKGYASLPFPFAKIDPPRFSMQESWDLERLVGYLGTWSATTRFREATGRDPLEAIRADLSAAWGDPVSERLVRWPLGIRVGRSNALAPSALPL